jgi:tetratricopeptide (TPR) repeat protein
MGTVINETADPAPRRKRIDSAKKYWWLPAIAVPVVVALIQVLPAILGGSAPAGTTVINNSRIGSDLYFVTNVQIEDPSARAQFEQGRALAEAGQYAEAKAILEKIPASVKSAAVFNNLAVVNAALGDDAAALTNVQQALQLEPANDAVRQNLNLLARVVKEQTANNTILTAAPVELGRSVDSSVATDGDSDFFAFTAAAGSRDIVRVHVENKSTMFAPRLRLFGENRAELGMEYTTTQGANLTMNLVTIPGAKYFAQVSAWSGSGAYALTASPQKAFDRYEPNDDILKPSDIGRGQDIQAGIMDSADNDVYRFPVSAGTVRAVFTNRSAGLAPDVTLYNADKSQVAREYATTKGANTSVEAPATASGTWYVKVSPWGDSAGDYTLRIE